ncbi:MAG: hypothetical protein JWR21_909 [Herminiimonas sp.]|nr:hypothetical protein [Herminiimonas sp.]
MQPTITESAFPERDQQILDALAGGAVKKDVAKSFDLTVGTIQKIVRRDKAGEVFALALTDGQQTVPVGHVKTSRGFIHACRCAKRKFSGTFQRLELPQWKLVSGSESISLNDAALQ